MAFLIQRCLTRGTRPHRLQSTFAGVLCVWTVLWLVLPGAAWNARSEEPSESQVKAAFLVNFPKYVDWPTNTFGATNSQIVLAVIGHQQVAEELQKMAVGKTINGRPLAVLQFDSSEDLTNRYAVLFIGSAERKTTDVLARHDGTGVLTVGESDEFLDQGGMIRFTRKDRNVRFEVNLAPARASNLRISSKLLSVADSVKGKAN